MRKVEQAFLVAVLLLASKVQAHETWLMPKGFQIKPGEELQVELTSGMRFPSPEHAIGRERMARAQLRLGVVSTDFEQFQKGAVTLDLKVRPASAGLATVALQLLPRTLELDDEKVREYLDEIDAPAEIREAWDEQKGKQTWKETYTKYAKTFVLVGEPPSDDTWRTPVGLGFELVPLENPFERHAGDTASFELFHEGKPLAGQPVGLIFEDETRRTFRVSDMNGRVKLPVNRSGRFLVFAVNLRHDEQKAQWVSDFTTLTAEAKPARPQIGKMVGSQDIGEVRHAGTLIFDASNDRYTISGSGENMWFNKDAFHFAWRAVPFDSFELSSDIVFVASGGNPHRKACLMIRQTLDADSAYVDVALHGDGLVSLQFRETQGGPTREIQANTMLPGRLAIQKLDDTVLLRAGDAGEETLRFAGPAARIALRPPYFVGIAVCAHDANALESAMFTDVRYSGQLEFGARAIPSVLEVQSIESTDRRVVLQTADRIEAPNWTPDGKSLIYNSKGRLYRIPATGGAPEPIDTGFATRCNNDHGVSPDGKSLVISDQSQGDGKSRIYTLPIEGGTPKLITPNAPSYWHGWSPDGKTLAYCAQREGAFDIYTIPVVGGEETRLTTAQGLDDGPEFSHDGKYLYFNSDRTGLMQIWRMDADGSHQVPVTDDEFNNWFPHPSPDGRFLVFLSYERDVEGHPGDKDVTLRRLTLSDGKVDVIAKMRGGQGTINVPCWSTDSKRIAFVSYPSLFTVRDR
jgi:uncharacterized GH25 family protein